MTKLLKYLKKSDWILAAACVAFIVGQVWLDLKMPDYMQEITVLAQTKGSALSEIWQAGGFMLLCAAGSLVFSVAAGYCAARIAASFAKSVRLAGYDKVQGFSMEEINGYSVSSLITRTTNDITQVQTLIAMGLQVIIKAPITAVWAITKIVSKSWQWSAATACVLVLVLAVVLSIVILVFPKFKVVQSKTDRLNAVTQENLSGVRVIRAYNAEEYQEEKFERANTELTKTQTFTNKSMAVISPVMNLFMNALVLAIYWIGAALIANAAGTERLTLFSEMMVFSQYALQMISAFIMMILIFTILPRALVSAGRISEVLSTQTKICDGELLLEQWAQGEVEFKNVSFRYPEGADYALKNISFKAESGETVAFIGAMGSGKSTLVNLIPRFYDATEGEILIDGAAIKNYKLKDLRKKIGYVPQKAVLFRGTVQSNVAFGDSLDYVYSPNRVKQSVEIAQGRDFVEEKENKYLSEVAQGGTNFSGGQKQRLSIARAVYRNPEIFIFDDSFSALDYKTDRELRKQLNEHTAGVTTFIVAQRIGTIKDADKIIVLDKGEVVGIGRHKELLKTCDVYREIALSQLSSEELGI